MPVEGHTITKHRNFQVDWLCCRYTCLINADKLSHLREAVNLLNCLLFRSRQRDIEWPILTPLS